jgi:hypothetical protein
MISVPCASLCSALLATASILSEILRNGLRGVGYPWAMAVPAALLQQLLSLGESERVEIAHALLASVDAQDGMSDAERARLHSAIERSLDEMDSGKTIPFDDVISALRAKRAARATR